MYGVFYFLVNVDQLNSAGRERAGLFLQPIVLLVIM